MSLRGYCPKCGTDVNTTETGHCHRCGDMTSTQVGGATSSQTSSLQTTPNQFAGGCASFDRKPDADLAEVPSRDGHSRVSIFITGGTVKIDAALSANSAGDVDLFVKAVTLAGGLLS